MTSRKTETVFLCAVLLSAVLTAACRQPLSAGLGAAKWDRQADGLLVSQKLILQDDEPWNVFTNQSLRKFKVNDPVQIVLASETTMRLTSYCLYPVFNMQIWADIAGYPEKVLILTLPQMDPLTQSEYTLPLCVSDGTYETETGKHISIPLIEAFSRGMISLEVASDDPVYRNITSLKTDWNITFGAYNADGTATNWWPMKPLYAREWIAMITNFASVLSSPEFETLFLYHYKDANGQNKEFHGKTTTSTEFDEESGTAEEVTDPVYFTPADYRSLYDRMMVKSSLNLGLVRAYEGLGGGATLGVSFRYFFSHYYYGAKAVVHEFGHCMGYGHDSSFCYGEFEGFLADLWTMFDRIGRVPYPDDDVVGFYREENRAVWYPDVQINQVSRKYRKNGTFNTVEKYIMAHPEYFPQAAVQLQVFR